MKNSHAGICLECSIQNSIEVCALDSYVAVQVSVAVMRKNDFTEDPRIAVETIAPPPQRQTSLLLPTSIFEPAQQVVRELAVQGFSQ